MASLKGKIQFYRSLATMESAGVPLLRSLRQRQAPGFSRVAGQIAAALESGRGRLSEVMQDYPKLFSPMEQRLIHLGETTGNLEAVFTSLASWYDGQLRLKRQLISGLVYPALQYHVAAVLIPVVQFFMNQGTVPKLAFNVMVLSGAPYALLFAVKVLLPALTPTFILRSDVLEHLLLSLPLFGALTRKINLYRFFQTWSLALRSGLSAAPAVALAADTCSSRVIRRKLHAISGVMGRANCPFSEAFRKVWPGGDRAGIILNMVETGEKSGHLDETSARLATMYRDESEQAFAVIGKVVPVLVYLALAGYLAFQIVRFWSQLVGNITSLL